MHEDKDDSAQVLEDLVQAAGGGDGQISPAPHSSNQLSPNTPRSLRRTASGRIVDFVRRSIRFKRSPSSPHRNASSPGFDKKSTTIDEVDFIRQTSLRQPSFFRRQDSIIFKVRPGQRFTQYADVIVDQPHKSPADLGNLGELKHLIQTGRTKQVKKYIRTNNWPAGHRVRAELWKELCKDSHRGGRIALYREKIDQLVGSGVKTLKPSFLSSEGVVVHDYSLKEEGAVSLQRLLTVVECVRPEITHVPILYPIGALFLHYMPEEEAFACVMHLLLASGEKFFMQTEVAVLASKMTLLALIKKHRSTTYQFLRHQTQVQDDDERLSQVLADWMAWIFRDLPFQHLLRVVDCFLYEGQKVLFRVTLALLDLWAKQRKQHPPLAGDDDSNMQRLVATAHDISDFVRNLHVPPDTLLKTAFGVRNLKGGHIKRLQERNELTARRTVGELSVTAVHRQEKKVRHHLSDVSFRSAILAPDTVTELIAALPGRLQLEAPRLLYRLSEDGASFSSFWGKIDPADQTIIIIRAVTGELFGAYCSSSWSERRDKYERAKTRFFGTGESFVWSVEPEVNSPIIYRWSGLTHEQPETCPQMFLAAGDTWFVIGGGGGEAIAIYDELTTGVSSNCDTFASPPLVRDGSFVIDDLEVYAVPSGCDD